MRRGFPTSEVCVHRVQRDFSKLVLVRVADHRTYAREGGDFFRGALRVAAGDDDLAAGVVAMNAADGGAGVLVGRGGYGAGVEDNDSGLGRVGGAL